MHTETVLETNDIETAAATRPGDALGYARFSTSTMYRRAWQMA